MKSIAFLILSIFTCNSNTQEESRWKIGNNKVDFFKGTKDANVEKKHDEEAERKDIADLFAEISIDEKGSTVKRYPPKHLMELLIEPDATTAGNFLKRERKKVEKILLAIEEISKIASGEKNAKQ